MIVVGLDCATKDDHPQTYHTGQGAPATTWPITEASTGSGSVPSDLKATANASLPIFEGARKVGIKQDGQFNVVGTATQSDYTPFVQAIKQEDSTYALSGSITRAPCCCGASRRCRA